MLYAPDEFVATLAATAAYKELSRQETILSDYMHDSEARRLVELDPGVWHDASPDLVEILALSRSVWSGSDGAFDPTVGPVTALWRTAFKSSQLPDPIQLQAALGSVGMDFIELDTDHNRVRFARRNMRLDFGGIGKGFAAQKALDILRQHGCASALVDLGGDIALGDPPPDAQGWRITIDSGLQEPREILLANAGIATSGDLHRHAEIDGVRYSHIVDPKTGLGLTRRVAVTVIAPDPWLADALASAASILGNEGSRAMLDAHPGVHIFIIETD